MQRQRGHLVRTIVLYNKSHCVYVLPGVGGNPEVPEVVVAEDEADERACVEGDGQADLVAGQGVPH